MVETANLNPPGTENGGEQNELLTICFRCGVCCSKYQVNISLVEARRISDTLVINWDVFCDRYLDKRWRGTTNFLLKQQNGACVFLQRSEGSHKTACLIHPFRPASCIEWTASLFRRECQEGLTKYWGLTVDASGELRGSSEKIRRFQRFLESLP